MVRASPAHLAALSLRAAQLLVRESVQVGVSAAEEPVAGPAHGALPGSEGARGGGAGCVRTAAPAPPRASPLHPGPRTPLGSTTHRARAGPVALQHAVGLVVARAGRAVGAEALAAPVAAGLLVAHEAGLALAALEGALSGAGGGGRAGLEGSAAAAPSGAGALRSGLRPLRPPRHATPRRAAPRRASLTRVLRHTELGTQLCCPVSHSSTSVQTWAGDGAPAGESPKSGRAPPPRPAPPPGPIRSIPSPSRPGLPLTCLLALAKANPTPSWLGPLYPGGQGSQRKPGLVFTQRTRGKHGWALHWGRQGRQVRGGAPLPWEGPSDGAAGTRRTPRRPGGARGQFRVPARPTLPGAQELGVGAAVPSGGGLRAGGRPCQAEAAAGQGRRRAPRGDSGAPGR